MIKKVTEKNGNDVVTYVWEVDETKPRVWLDGYHYRFNTKLIEVIRISTKTR